MQGRWDTVLHASVVTWCTTLLLVITSHHEYLYQADAGMSTITYKPKPNWLEHTARHGKPRKPSSKLNDDYYTCGI